MAFGHGKVSYIQIPSGGKDDCAEFYRRVFGWELRDGTPEHRSFTDASGDLIGAFVTQVEPAAPGVLPYISVDEINDAVAAIEANGGEIVTPVYDEESLKVATFRDPAGNVIGIWQGP